MSETNVANELHTQIQYRLIEKLSESERRYRELIESLQEIVFKCDRQGHLTFVNRAWMKTLGHPIAEVSGSLLSDFLHPSDRRLWQQALVELGNGTSICQELRFCHQNTSIIWLELSIQTSSEPEFSGSLMNINDRKQTAELLQQANQERQTRVEQRATELDETNQQLTTLLQKLQQTQSQLVQAEKMSSLGQLVAGIAHEINNPVNFIHGNLMHMEQDIENLLSLLHLYQQHYPNPVPAIQTEATEFDLSFLQEDLPRILSSMKIGTDRIRQIVLSLRNFSRLDEAEFKVVDVHEGIDSTLMILQNRLRDQPKNPAITVIKQYGQLPPIECYPGQLNQVVMNILVNAIDAIEECNANRILEGREKQPGQITIRTIVFNAEWVHLAIKDNGSGISESILQYIFNPFFTTKSVGKGTGMGMSISHQIITEKHGGKLECFSSSGSGAEFIIQIPIRQPIQRRTNLFTADE
jgi:two-component system, NtrC family, sensor kinase